MMLAHTILALLAWFAATLIPAAQFACEDRDLPRHQQRGVSILPAWPLVPILASTPAFALGAAHIVTLVVSALHLGLLAYSVYSILVWHRRRLVLDRATSNLDAKVRANRDPFDEAPPGPV